MNQKLLFVLTLLASTQSFATTCVITCQGTSANHRDTETFKVAVMNESKEAIIETADAECNKSPLSQQYENVSYAGDITCANEPAPGKDEKTVKAAPKSTKVQTFKPQGYQPNVRELDSNCTQR